MTCKAEKYIIHFLNSNEAANVKSGEHGFLHATNRGDTQCDFLMFDDGSVAVFDEKNKETQCLAPFVVSAIIANTHPYEDIEGLVQSSLETK